MNKQVEEEINRILDDIELVQAETPLEETQEKSFSLKEKLEEKLEQVKKIEDGISLYEEAKVALKKEEIDENYYKYLENSLEGKFFCDVEFDKICSNILLEVVCPELLKIEDYDSSLLEIRTIGSHYEELTNYIDKICTYGKDFVCLFGINETNAKKYIKYNKRKFSRSDMIEAVKSHLEANTDVNLSQYDEYYVVEEEDSLKVFSERKIVSLVKVEETIFDKIKCKFANIFNKSIFNKRRYLPNVDLIFETNGNRLDKIEIESKIDAKSRMKMLLNAERKETRII